MSLYPVVLAIDFGTQRVGVAISRGSLAEPLRILPNQPSLVDDIQAIINDEQVEQLVVGISENEMARQTQAFVDQLKKVVTVPVELVDETLSSHTVATQLKEAGAPLRTRQQPIDDRAAAVFLQEYLDSQG